MSNDERILVLTTEFPYPLDNGGKIRTYNMIKGISEKYNIDLICFSESDRLNIGDLKNLCSNIKIVHKIFTNSKSKINVLIKLLKCVLSNNPFIVQKFVDKQYLKLIKKFINNNNYNTILFDHLNITIYAKYIDDLKINKILSQHNCEYLILKRRYENEKNIFKKIYLKYEYKKTKQYEESMCKKFDNVIVLTEEDKNCICNNNYKGSNISIIPISVDTNYTKKNYNNCVKKLLFLGTMSWYPNEHGILWFLENVWPAILNKCSDMQLYIVGKNPSNEIKKYDGNNVIVTGYVDDVNEYIELCDICVVPLFIGGGMRVKILECMSKGIPIISTSIGAEGINYVDGKNVFIANSKKEFIEGIYELNNNNVYRTIKDNGINLIKNEYSIDIISKRFIDIVNENIY
ncbi:glycosyltransferase family 4 protein [Clostridium tyrobutyricum]|uniref:glycosyltransferase n=1 Tax=Clostridium tyrobutyricum TaxID=1519 RepID=UPI001C392DB1|nr:glycosyltransferase [Clostridium tyrobutyricum]MBV4432327.1 glycosyltransferase family 4 protein [Clostridium tyrobutyricum]